MTKHHTHLLFLEKNALYLLPQHLKEEELSLGYTLSCGKRAVQSRAEQTCEPPVEETDTQSEAFKGRVFIGVFED